MPHRDPEARKAYARKYAAAHREEFAARSRAWNAANPVQARANRRDYARRNPELIRRAQRKYRGIPEAPYPAPAVCECCKRTEKLFLDHDHITGAFRGWICNRCNTGIGMLGDETRGILRALNYTLRKAGMHEIDFDSLTTKDD